ncbi:regulator of G-protein signaling 7a isoform X2 [Electrophorus electricus]|uniref:regulator of G-protein signaling 7a isoform X2 n=1 Tax=Electrophorus electricus TaxID=8005 RepID=UPI0015D059CD|nr:regulator of G-protein signaling 7a isoform X2 [Electrophorus electricus]
MPYKKVPHKKHLMMGKICELSQDLCNLIVAKHTDGIGYRRISKLLKVLVSTVGAIIRKWKEHHFTINWPQPGAPRKISDRRVKNIRRVVQEPRTTCGELQKDLESAVEALHLGTLMAAHGYFFPISDHVLVLKDDGTFYRFQTPYFWPSNCWEPENTDYAVYLCKRTMQNKARLELADYEAESLARLQRAFARKWEFIFMQAEAQAKVDKKRDKVERKILDSQERAFWDVHRPVSVYGLQNDIRSHSPTHTPAPEAKQPTTEELHEQIKFWQAQLDRHRLKMSKVAEGLLGYTEQHVDYDPFLLTPDPSNPWISDDTTFWELEASKEPTQSRVKRWGFGIDEVLKDPAGREQFLKFLESEFSSENLSFWLAVQELKRRPVKEVPCRVQEIWQEFLAPGAPSAINLDSKSYDKTTQNVKDPGRYSFEDAQEHIYKLMKSDSYSRFIRSSVYQELLQAKKKRSKNLF